MTRNLGCSRIVRPIVRPIVFSWPLFLGLSFPFPSSVSCSSVLHIQNGNVLFHSGRSLITSLWFYSSAAEVMSRHSKLPHWLTWDLWCLCECLGEPVVVVVLSVESGLDMGSFGSAASEAHQQLGLLPWRDGQAAWTESVFSGRWLHVNFQGMWRLLS